MKKELHNIRLEEVEPFLNSLTIERASFTLPLYRALGAEFITGARAGNDLVGIGGMMRSYRFIPVLYMVVKSESQGKGIGDEIMQELASFARKKHHFLTLTVYKDNLPALNLYLKYRFKISCEMRSYRSYWMCLSFNRRGRIICALLRPVFATYYAIDSSPARNVLRAVHDFLVRVPREEQSKSKG